MAMLLALTMIVSLVPNVFRSAKAALGETFSDEKATGLTGNINTKDTISWPIKIYDYLSDGMLFEYSSASDFYGYDRTFADTYVNGSEVPMDDSTVVGMDFTMPSTYESFAFKYWGNSIYGINYDTTGATEVKRSITSALNDRNPMSLHLEYVGTTGTRSYGWVANFARDNGKYYTGDDVRYMVMVYKTNDTYEPRTFRTYWAVSDSAYESDYYYHGGSIDISDLTDDFGWALNGEKTGTLISANTDTVPASSDNWSYFIVDMKTDYANDTANGIATNWARVASERVAGVGMSFPLGEVGDEMDISHIAFFSSEEACKTFGDKAVYFNNFPGQYAGYPVQMTQSISDNSFEVTKGWDFTDKSSSAATNGWNDSTYQAWSPDMSCDSLTNSANGATYLNVTNNDAYIDYHYVWDTTGTFYSRSDYRYITVVYRTHSITSPAIGFWLEDTVYGYVCGKSSSYRQGITASSTNWVSYTFDLTSLSSYTNYSYVATFDKIGMYFPGFTSSSQSMDIAYIEYHSSSDEAAAFATMATNYMNGIETPPAVTTNILTTLNTGSNQAFTMLYASTGGGWFDDGYVDTGSAFKKLGYYYDTSNYDYRGIACDNIKDNGIAGGDNPWTNGYMSYQIGACALETSAKANIYRTLAQSNGYDISDSIFLLNMYPNNTKYVGSYYTTESAAKVASLSSSKTNLIGADYEILRGVDDDGDVYYYAGNKSYDMSQLDLGYTLYNTLKDGVMTAGLLQSGLATHKGMDGQEYKVMNYKEDTVYYIARLLQNSLVIPEFDGYGINYNFVMGTPSPRYCEDVDGDGKLDLVAEDLPGKDGLPDGHLDVNEDKNGNGLLDLSEDIDGDGHLDVYEDLNNNGILDESEDLDGDGHLDVDEDLDGDGLIDPGEDVDGDGKLDVDEDRNGNGNLDLDEDIDGDSKLDVAEDKNGNGILDLGEDLDGDEWLDTVDEDLDGDGHLDVAEDKNGNGRLDECDLASALRQCLGITFTDANYTAKDKTAQATPTAGLGSYNQTAAKFTAGPNGENLLIGPFLKCAPYINTFHDAAYYLLHNLFVPGSYNEVQTDYNYLVMSKGYVTAEDKYAYVFDAGFTYDDGTIGTVYNDTEKTIAQMTAEDKYGIYYTESYTTTLCPFLPINDDGENVDLDGDGKLDPENEDKNNNGVLDEGEDLDGDEHLDVREISEFTYNGTPYILEDGATSTTLSGATYEKRNYNYVMTANGEFVYHESDDLFFDFEGDDDVYMFINGELVLDIGAAHSITVVGFNMNDYVKAAREALEFLKPYGYNPDMDEDIFLNLFTADTVTQYTFDEKGNVTSSTEISNPLKGKYTDEQIQELLRQHRLNLVDGNSYTIDFYYMERHGWGANMRIATNIVMTNPDMITDKTAYQGTDANGDPQEITYGGLIDDSQPINYSFSLTNSNKSNTKLYKLSFLDTNIGVNLSAANGLQVFGKPTETKFNVTADTTLSVMGLNGVIVLNENTTKEKRYNIRADGTLSWIEGEISHSSQSLKITYDKDDAKNNDYTLTLYQYDDTTLFNDVDVQVILGSGASAYTPELNENNERYLKLDASNTVRVMGVRVTDANGRALDPGDLTITIDGYASEEDYAAYAAAYKAYQEEKRKDPTIAEFEDKWCIDTISISVSNNAELKAFLTDLQDPAGQTSEGEGVPAGKSALYYGAGLWKNGTVTISGMWYTLTEEERANKVFKNTVDTAAYKSMNSEDPIPGEDTHIVYSPGEPMYYQWADKPVFLEFDKLWTDVVNASQSTVNSLYVQNVAIQKLTDSVGVDNLDVEVVDRNGGNVAAINNYYEYGKWTTLPGSERTAADGYRTIYFKQIYDWKDASGNEQLYVYYWSDANKEMTKWPGEPMSYTKTDDDGKLIYQFDIPSNARYVIFNNGIGSTTRVQTEDIPVPIVDYDKVAWDESNRVLNVNYDSEGMHMFYVKASGWITEKDEDGNDVENLYTALVPVTFYVTYVEDKTYVLDYGLITEELTSGGALFTRDGLLGGHNTTQIELMGITTQEPSYTTTYTTTAANNGDINRILFTPEAGVKVNSEDEEDTTICYEVDDGKFYVSESVDSDGLTISYNNSRYLMNRKIWFEPTDFMDQEINLWLALSVHEKNAVKPSKTAADGQSQYHVPAPSGEGSVDIATEVQMYKKITIVPATVVYYEDDFAGVTYSGDQGKFEHYGEGSGTLTQGVDQTVPYGQDSTYQNGSNSEFSGASMTTINIADTSDVASFSFKGTGFEIISRTNAFDSASFVVTVKDSDGNVVKNLPIITEFTSSDAVCEHKYHNTNGYCTYCGKYVGHTNVENVCTVCNAPAVKYYLMGYINNADHDAGSTAFELQDGKLTLTFDSESYLAVHDSNGNEFYTFGYAENATSVMMYNLSSFTEQQKKDKVPDKLRVPGGVEVTLTLVDSGSGALVLSYTHDPIVHGDRTLYYNNSTTQWEKVYIHYWTDTGDLTTFPGVEMERLITEDNIYYYQVPAEAEKVLFNNGEGGSGNQTTDQTIPGDNYAFKDGKWYVFGEEEPVTSMMTVYFQNTSGWDAPYAYYWSEANKSMTSWPGTAMTLVEGTLYSIQIPADAENIIFSNNGASQSSDLAIPGDNHLYNNGTWSEYAPDAPTSNTIYFDNSMYNWSDVRAHYWNSDTNTEWPGLAMTLVEGSIYSIEVPLDYTGILFNNGGNGKQTDNATIPGDGYLYSFGTWIEYEPGDDTTYTVFFDNSVSKFTTPKAHYWSNDSMTKAETTWPGTAMTKVTDTLYSIEIPLGISNIIFNDNGANQTTDLVVPGENYVFDIGWHVYGEEVTYRTVYFKNTSLWSNPTVYYWSDEIIAQMINWPGTAMTHVGDGIYSAQIRADADYVEFSNNGSENQKTSTISLDEDLPCYLDGEWTTYPPPAVDRQLYYKNTMDWDQVYIYYWSTSNTNMVAWPGVPMTYMYGDTYTALVPTDVKFVMFNDGTPTQKLTLGSGDLYANGQWSYFLEESGRTIYYKNTNNWANPTAYVLTETGEVIIKSMVKATNDYYTFVVPTNAVDISFANGATEAMELPTVNDTYLPDGSWANAYLYSERVIYFKLPEGWTTPYVYAETSYTGAAPGVPMTKLAGTEDIYFYDTGCLVWSVTFNDVKKQIVEKEMEDGTTVQETVLTVLNTTGEVSVPNVTNNYYVDGQWEIYGDRVVFFRNYLDLWEDVYAYYWHTSTGEDDPSISGMVHLTPKNDYANYYYCVIPAGADHISFAQAIEEKVTLPAATSQVDVYNKNSLTAVWTKYSKQLVYYKNTDNLKQPYIFYWAQNQTAMTTWCGKAMTHLEGDIWYYELPANATFAFFSSGNVTNRVVVSSTDNLYNGSRWVTYVTGETKEIQQVPVIRVNDLPYGEYTVTISGMPTYKDDTDWSKYQDKDYMASQVQTTYLYLDGVRIYQPMTATNVNYMDTENGATFTELRDLILEGKAAVATYDKSTAVYTGNLSWSENRNGFEDVDENGNPTTNYLCNQLTDINDYMTVGPNNEVYVNGNVRDEAVIFYVKEQANTDDRTLQIAARAVNDTLFLSGQKSELMATLYQGVLITKPDKTTSYGWDAVDVIESGTEQYYVIDYTKCPYDEATGNYQVALYVRNGMVSFTTVKHNGLDISSTGMSQTSYKYTSDGCLVEINNEVEGEEIQANGVIFSLAGVSAQMASQTFVGEENVVEDTLTVPTLELVNPSLAFDDEIRYNIYFTASDVTDVVEMGLAIFDERLTDGTIADATEVVAGVVTCGDEYMAHTRGIAAKNMGDMVYFKVYAKLTDGSYVYSDVAGYNAVAYAKSMLANSNSTAMKALVVSMLNYGAAAQQYFGYKTDALMNADLTAEQQALVSVYDESMVASLVSADASKLGSFAATTGGFSKLSASVSFEGAFSINYYFTPGKSVDGDVTMYYWTADTYNSAAELTAENAFASYAMVPGEEYWGSVVDIAAKRMDETIYVAAVYTSGGEICSTGVLAYSLGRYCESIASDDASGMQPLAQATAVYGSYAKDYFAN